GFIFPNNVTASNNDGINISSVSDSEFENYLSENGVSELDLASYDNVTAIKINNGSDNLVIVRQSYLHGEPNKAQVNITGNNNTTFSDQIGSDNNSYIFINGNSNIAVIGQYGFDNNAIINQNGDSNSAHLLQIGTGNNNILEQNGDNNRALIINKQYSNNLSNTGSQVTQTGDSTVYLINGMSRYNISVNTNK
ncbi:hypothetical protein, partial [Vibrio rumoiensis]